MSKQSEDDLLADEIEDEGEEDQINKDSLPDERNAVPAHASRQLQDKTARILIFYLFLNVKLFIAVDQGF